MGFPVSRCMRLVMTALGLVAAFALAWALVAGRSAATEPGCGAAAASDSSCIAGSRPVAPVPPALPTAGAARAAPGAAAVVTTEERRIDDAMRWDRLQGAVFYDAPAEASARQSAANRPRVACLISGFLRNFEEVLDGCPGGVTSTGGGPDVDELRNCPKGGYLRRRVLDPLDCDVFVSTWDIRGFGGRGVTRYDSSQTLTAAQIRHGFGRKRLRGLHIESYLGSSSPATSPPPPLPVALQASNVAPSVRSMPDQDRDGATVPAAATPTAAEDDESKFSHERNFTRREMEKRYFWQVKPRLLMAAPFASAQGLAGNIEWGPDDSDRVVESLRLLRRNDYSQAYKQWCVLALASLYERRLRLAAAPTRARTADSDGYYDFYFRTRPDIRSRAVIVGWRWADAAAAAAAASQPLRRRRVAEFKLERRQPGGSGGGHGGGSVHTVHERRLHVHARDLSDFVMLASANVTRTVIRSLYRQTLRRARSIDAATQRQGTPPAGTFAEYNLMFWHVIFAHEKGGAAATDSDAHWEVDSGGGYVKMSTKGKPKRLG